jgi:hypothetical protein
MPALNKAPKAPTKAQLTKAAAAKTKIAAAKAAPTVTDAPTPAPIVAANKPDAAAAALALSALIAEQRQTASSIYAQADSVALSIPVKSVTAYKRTYKQAVTAHPSKRKPSPRQAAALAVALTANGTTPADGATFSRNFEMRGAPYTIENGALSDCIASGLCSYDSTSGTITLLNLAELRAQCGSKAITI